jgi:hypothetical protein
MSRLRGWIGEQSFELAENYEQIVERYCESQVYSSVYRTEIERKQTAEQARIAAHHAVIAFRRTKDTSE